MAEDVIVAGDAMGGIEICTARATAPSEQSARTARGELPAWADGPRVRQLMARGSALNADVVQRAVTHDAPTAALDQGRAGTVQVTNIQGTPLGPGANAPTDEGSPLGWKELMDAGHTLGNSSPNNSHYNAVRMHLWNGRLGGPGKSSWNLAPGPAQVNSQMSAGIEDSAKDAVANGENIWLRTRVTYQNNTPNAHVFESVIPKDIGVQWGPMSTGPNGTATETWSTTIDQPAGAMSSGDIATLGGLIDGDTAALDTMLTGRSMQIIAQAYVHLAGKPLLLDHMLMTYPSIFAGMPKIEKTTILNGLSAADVDKLITAQGASPPPPRPVISQFYALMADQNVIDHFARYDQAMQANIALYGGDLFMDRLGVDGDQLSMTVSRLFRLRRQQKKIALLDAKTAEQISDLLDGVVDNALFRAWAMSHAPANTNELVAFFEARLTETMAGNIVGSFDVQQAITKEREVAEMRRLLTFPVDSLTSLNKRFIKRVAAENGIAVMDFA